jgi:short-subunit dehydrogenase
MRGFHESLRADLQGSGLGATLIVAGEVASDYWANNPGSRERLPRIARIYPVLRPEQVGAAVVRAVEREQRQVVIPALLRATLWLHRLLPWTAEALVYRTGWRRGGRMQARH